MIWFSMIMNFEWNHNKSASKKIYFNWKKRDRVRERERERERFCGCMLRDVTKWICWFWNSSMDWVECVYRKTKRTKKNWLKKLCFEMRMKTRSTHIELCCEYFRAKYGVYGECTQFPCSFQSKNCRTKDERDFVDQ